MADPTHPDLSDLSDRDLMVNLWMWAHVAFGLSDDCEPTEIRMPVICLSGRTLNATQTEVTAADVLGAVERRLGIKFIRGAIEIEARQ